MKIPVAKKTRTYAKVINSCVEARCNDTNDLSPHCEVLTRRTIITEKTGIVVVSEAEVKGKFDSNAFLPLRILHLKK